MLIVVLLQGGLGFCCIVQLKPTGWNLAVSKKIIVSPVSTYQTNSSSFSPPITIENKLGSRARLEVFRGQ